MSSSGMEGLDEISITDETRVSELHDNKIKNYTVKPEDFGLKRAGLEEIKGGDKKQNARILKDLLENREKGPKRDIVLLNAAAAIVAGGKAGTLKEGVELAGKSIDTGKAKEKLDKLVGYCNKIQPGE